MAKDTKDGKRKDAAVLKRARERFAYVTEYESDNRKAQKEDTEFVFVPGAQWPARTRTLRESWGDPCLEFPQLSQFVAQVVNDQRQNRPGIRVIPASGEASEDTADILQGLIRGIEYHSNAEAVYDCAYQHAVTGGRGYWRIVSEYEKPDSFNQRLVVRRIADAMAAYLDPDYQDPDGGDRSYGFVVEVMTREAFKARWPKADPVSIEADGSEWAVDEDHVLVADYYERVLEPRVLVALSDGNTAYEDELPPLPPHVQIVDRRDVEVPRVDWYTIAGGEQILERHEWPGTIIPIVCTWGDEVIVNNKRLFQGLIRRAKDAQVLFNFGMTQQAVSLALTPRAPYIAALGQIAQNPAIKEMWDNANTRNYSALYYEPQSIDGTLLPPPARQPGSAPDSGWLNWTQQMSMLMRSTIGMYENSLGMKGQETSGRAIMAREQQGDTATFHYLDNLGRAIALTGRIIIECIPTYYDTERIVNIIGPDDVARMETINREVPNPLNPLEAIRVGDVTTGEYAVAVESGPTYATKKKEKADLMMGMVQAYPPLMQIAPDLIVKAQDLPDGDQLAKRLKMTLPPQIAQAVAAEEQGQNPPDPAVMAQMQEMQGQMEQMGQQMQMLQGENQQLKMGAEQKMAAAQMDAQVKAQASQTDAQIEMAKAQQMAEIEMAKAQIEQETALRRAEIEQQTKLAVAQLQAARAPQAGDGTGGEVSGEIAEEEQANVVMLALAEAISKLAVATAAPRKLDITEFAADGTPVGGVSSSLLQ